MPQSAKGMNLALIKKSPLTLRISSNRPAAERAFPLLVELNEGGRITVRQYNIHIGAAGTVEPVEVVAMGAAAPEAAAPITAAQPVAKQSAPVTQKADPIVSATKTRSQTETKTEMSPLERMQSKHYDLSKPFWLNRAIRRGHWVCFIKSFSRRLASIRCLWPLQLKTRKLSRQATSDSLKPALTSAPPRLAW